MKKIALLVLAVCMAASMDAQTSRKKIEKFADEAVRQIALTGRKPTIDILDSLSNNAEVSVEMVSRMGAPDDARQQRACLRLIDDIVDFSQQETGRKYTDVIRKGLTKALDRSFEPDVQLHVMEQLARIAKPADAAHIAMYLEMPELAQTASDILVNMPDIDDRIRRCRPSWTSVLENDPSRRLSPPWQSRSQQPYLCGRRVWTRKWQGCATLRCPRRTASS